MNAAPPLPSPNVPPEGWATDEVSSFSELSYKNEWATFDSFPDLRALLVAIDAMFLLASSAAMQQSKNSTEPAPLLLRVLAHSHFRGAIKMMMAAHCSPAYPALRASLESSLYSWYLSRRPEAAKRWHEKPPAGEERFKWGREFSVSVMSDNVAKTNSDVARRIRHWHQVAIDFGSHPNTDGLYANLLMFKLPDGGVSIQLRYLHDMGPMLLATADCVFGVGLVSLELFRMALADGIEDGNALGGLDALIKQYVEWHAALPRDRAP